MFKDRAFQVKMVKETPAFDGDCNRAHFDASEINNILNHQVRQGAIAVGGVILLTAVTKTFSEVLIHTAKTLIK